jgi:hypothetical protein
MWSLDFISLVVDWIFTIDGGAIICEGLGGVGGLPMFVVFFLFKTDGPILTVPSGRSPSCFVLM